ncbi:MAG: tetratricopeptide repeat protein [bacterium]
MDIKEKDKRLEAITLLGNIEHSAIIGELSDLDNYSKLLEDYQQFVYKIISKHLIEYKYRKREDLSKRGIDIEIGYDYEWHIAGDSFNIYLYSGDPLYDIVNILLLATKIKLAWFTSKVNMRNIREERSLIDITMGIDAGWVLLSKRPWRIELSDDVPRIEGPPVNRLKTIAMLASKGRFSKIFLTEPAFRFAKSKSNIPLRVIQKNDIQVEGTMSNLQLFELAAFWDHEVFEYLPDGLKEDILGNLEQAFKKIYPTKQHLWVYPLVFRYYLRQEDDQVVMAERLDSIIKHGVALLRSFTENEIKESIDYYITINNMIGNAYILRNRYDDDIRMALKTFRNTLRYAPNNIQSAFKLAECMITKKNYDSASKLYRYILTIDPDNVKARKLLDEMEKI